MGADALAALGLLLAGVADQFDMLVGFVAVELIESILRELQGFGKGAQQADAHLGHLLVASEVNTGLSDGRAAGHRFGPCRRCQRGASSLRVSAPDVRRRYQTVLASQAGRASAQRPRGYSRENGGVDHRHLLFLRLIESKKRWDWR